MLETLKELEQWVCWKYEEGRKVPVNARTGSRAKSTAKTTWSKYSIADRSFQVDESLEGMGFVFDREDGLVGIDVDKCVDDNGEINELGKYILEKTQHTYQEWSPSGKGFHVIGKGSLAGWTKHKDQNLGLEVYEKGRFFTMSFNQIEDSADDVADIQEALDLIYMNYLVSRRQHRDNQTNRQYDSQIPYYEQGERDNGLFIEAMRLFHKGVSKGRAYACIQTIAQECRPPFDEEQARAKVDSAWKCGDPHPGDKVKELNQKYAMLGDGTVLKEPKDHNEAPALLLPSALKRVYEPDKVRFEDREGRVQVMNAFEFWMRSPERRAYSRIVFKPNGDCDADEYNLWSGFAVKPASKGSCEYFKQHINENLCKGDEEQQRYLWDWLAALVQDPGSGPKTAPVIIGGQGVGKSCIGDYLEKMIGRRHYSKISNYQHFLGRFNSEQAMSILIHVDEAIWGGDKRPLGALKAMITDPTTQLEQKGRDRVQIDNNVHLLVTSNEDWPVHAETGERRFVVLDMGKRAEAPSQEFFEKFYAELAGNGPAALLAYLKSRKVERYDPVPPPPTKRKRDLQERSMNPEDRAIANWLEREKIATRQKWEQVLTVNEIYEALQMELDNQKAKRHPTVREATQLICDRLGAEYERRNSTKNKTRRRYGIEEDARDQHEKSTSRKLLILPDLEEAKRRFEAYIEGR